MSQSKIGLSSHSSYAKHLEAQRALERALQLPTIERMERLITLSHEYPHHGPTWMALAEEHAMARRNEEAAGALRRALSCDPSLRSDASDDLRLAAPHVLDAASVLAEEAAAEEAAAASMGGGGPMPMDGGSRSAAQRQLDQAMKLPASKRCDRLAELALRNPTHAPTWLSLAEEHLANSHVEYALSAYERALSIDSALSAVASRKLEALRRYHRRKRIDIPAKVERTVPPSPWMSNQHMAPAEDAPQQRRPRSVARGTEPPPLHARHLIHSPAPGASPDPAPAAQAASPGSSVHEALGRALEKSSRAERVAALRELERQAPAAPAVLFHLALELALADEREAARQVGERLMRISPAYYRRLYEVAERHWPAADQPKLAGVGGKAAAPTKMMEVPASLRPTQRPFEAPKVEPEVVAQRTMVLPVETSYAPRAVPQMKFYPALSMPSLPPQQQQQPQRSSINKRTVGFLVAGVLIGMLLVALLTLLLPAAG
ncbi:hypothetical protein [Haliangium ochraceum]|uniref:Tetratricopeptide repeat protein n=1 Tax=Haliangium ochraceum (strain DSM 14365 / JCM 11303 / SMP-2) TaxID=502025 RepID=D0LFU7_HALO1|nr:hypothetical protein [Haliangium ochraceum]ACY14549.1 Tetratricopeptide repeat protein [Haliangium ochraceum DSM 14365]